MIPRGAFIVVIALALACGADAQTSLGPYEPVPPEVPDPCPEVPGDAVSVSYRILATISYGRHVPETPPSPALESADSPASLFDGQVIGAPADLRAALGWSDADTRALDVDWDRSRVLVFDAFASYRLGELYGKTVLSGIYERGGSIVVHSTHTNYGPCQGIRQDPSWFSFGGDYLLLVIPREPEPITRWDCSIGGCPPDIP